MRVYLIYSDIKSNYNFLFFLAGLQAIPKSIIEAAAIDGASFWKRFGTIVIPLPSNLILRQLVETPFVEYV